MEKKQDQSFEEQFPSLKGKEEWTESVGFIPDSMIQEHCVDKQKVREAIEKVLKNQCDSGEWQNHVWYFSELKERLGL